MQGPISGPNPPTEAHVGCEVLRWVLRWGGQRPMIGVDLHAGRFLGRAPPSPLVSPGHNPLDAPFMVFIGSDVTESRLACHI